MNNSIMKALPFMHSPKLGNGFTCVLASNYCKSFFSSADHVTLKSYHSDSEDTWAATNVDKNNKCSEFDLKEKESESKALEENATPVSISKETTVLSSIPDKQDSETDKLTVDSNGQEEHEDRLPPEPPVYCCGTGCPNCSWIIYAEELKNYYNKDIDRSKISLELDKIQDPSVRMFVKMELGL